MLITYKCSWCGRSFTKKGLIGGTTDGAFLNKVGLKKDYCSTACKTAAQQTVACFDEYEKGTGSYENFGKAIQQKLDEGVYLLKKNTETEEDYYLTQGQRIKDDFDNMFLKKRRNKSYIVLAFPILFTIVFLSYVFDYYFYLPMIGVILGVGIGVVEFIFGRKLINKFIK